MELNTEKNSKVVATNGEVIALHICQKALLNNLFLYEIKSGRRDKDSIYNMILHHTYTSVLPLRYTSINESHASSSSSFSLLTTKRPAIAASSQQFPLAFKFSCQLIPLLNYSLFSGEPEVITSTGTKGWPWDWGGGVCFWGQCSSLRQTSSLGLGLVLSLSEKRTTSKGRQTG